MTPKPAQVQLELLQHHTRECWAARVDPGAACICRPPAVIEPHAAPTTKAKP